MSGVNISYNGSAIASMTESGTKTLKTEGKYCESDIAITYEEAQGGVDWNTASNITPAYSVSSASGASYGFLPNSDGYYESENKGVKSSAAVCKVTFFPSVDAHLYVDCINFAETKYDYGLLSEIDKTLGTTYTADTENVFKTFYNEQSADVVTIDYGYVPAGEHFIYIKYRKDSSTDENNDSLQFKIRFTTASIKDDISHAIESKGVEVADTVELADVADLIETINTNAGAEACTVNVSFGSNGSGYTFNAYYADTTGAYQQVNGSNNALVLPKGSMLFLTMDAMFSATCDTTITQKHSNGGMYGYAYTLLFYVADSGNILLN